MIRVDAEIRSDGKGLLDDVARTELGVLEQRPGRALRIGPARADRDHPLLGLEHVAHAGDDERMLTVGDGEHGLEAAQDAVGTPVLGELHRGAHEVALVLVELGLEALEQGERVGGAAREAGEDAILVEAPHLFGAALDHDVAEGDVAVAAERDHAVAAYREDGVAVELFHSDLLKKSKDEARVRGNQAGRGRTARYAQNPTAVIMHTISGPAGRSLAIDTASPAP